MPLRLCRPLATVDVLCHRAHVDWCVYWKYVRVCVVPVTWGAEQRGRKENFFYVGEREELSSVSSHPATSHSLVAGTWHHCSLHVSSKKCIPGAYPCEEWAVKSPSDGDTKASGGCWAHTQGRISKERQDKLHVSEGACWSCSQRIKLASGEGQCLKVFFWPAPHKKKKKKKKKCVWFPTNSVQIVKNSLFFLSSCCHIFLCTSLS